VPYNRRMYSAVLILHSLLRWIVLITGVLAIARSLPGWGGNKPWTSGDDAAGKWFISSVDLQLLLGLLLYFALSPLTRGGLADFAGAMRAPALRFWMVEHAMGMVLAVVLAHVGRVLIRKTRDTGAKHKRAVIFFGLALLLILLSIPWPGMPAARPLLRF
jgi:hypothetical protein